MDPAGVTIDLTKAGAIIADMIESYRAGGTPPSNPEGDDHDDLQDCRPTSVAASLHLHSSIDAGASPIQSGARRVWSSASRSWVFAFRVGRTAAPGMAN